MCSGDCYDLTSDPAHCGSCTNKCGANKVCQSTGNSGVCACSTPLQCGGCGSWNFESSTNEAWVAPGADHAGISNGVSGPISASSTRAHAGSYSLKVPIAINQTSTYVGYVYVPICGAGSTVNLANAVISAWIYLEGPALGMWSTVTIGTPDMLGGADPGSLRVGQWFQVKYASSATQANEIAIELNVNASDGAWSGTMYIDDVLISGA